MTDTPPPPTRAMVITLFDAVDQARHHPDDIPARIRPSLYPGGQMRLIRAGLERRRLIDANGTLTNAGLALGRETASRIAKPDGWIKFIAQFEREPEPEESAP